MVVNEMTYKSGSGYLKNRNLIKKLKDDLFDQIVCNNKVRNAIREEYDKESRRTGFNPKILTILEVWEKSGNVKITLKDGFVEVVGDGLRYSYY